MTHATRERMMAVVALVALGAGATASCSWAFVEGPTASGRLEDCTEKSSWPLVDLGLGLAGISAGATLSILTLIPCGAGCDSSNKALNISLGLAAIAAGTVYLLSSYSGRRRMADCHHLEIQHQFGE